MGTRFGNEIEVQDTLELERLVLSEMIKEEAFVPEGRSLLKTDYFRNEESREVWNIVCGLADSSVSVDIVTVGERMREKSHIVDYTSTAFVPSLQAFVAHCEALATAHIRRTIYNRALTIATRAADTTLDSAALLALPSGLTECANEFLGTGERAISISESIEELDGDISRMEEEAAFGKGRMLTGFSKLDMLLPYGIAKGNLLVIAARPSVGKTALMLQIARNVAESGFGAMVYSLEMTRGELAERIVKAKGDATFRDFANKGQALHEKLRAAAKEMRDIPLYIRDDIHSVDEIAADITRQCLKGKCDIAFIDHLHLMTGTDRNLKKTEQVGEITKRLKTLAKQLRIPIVLLSQLNRESEKENRAPILSDLRDSGTIEQDADIVWMLERETRTKQDNVLVLWLRKMRNAQADSYMKMEASNSFTKFVQID